MKFFKLLIIFGFLFPLSSQAVGVSVSPASVSIFHPNGIEQNINIKNISQEPIVVKVYADEFSANINISPNEFELLPDQLTVVSVSADFEKYPQGVQKTNLSVLSKALDKRSFNAISGLKIPVDIYINHSSFIWSGEAVFVIVFFSLLFIIALMKLFWVIVNKKPKKKRFLLIDFSIYHKKKWYKFW